MSNPLQEFPATLSDRLAALETAREMILNEISDGVDAKPENGWSVSEITYHLYLVEKIITTGIQKTLAAQKVERKSDEYLRFEWEQIAERVPGRKQRIVAPEGSVPANCPPLSEIPRYLKESRNALKEVLNNTTLDDLASIEIQHPVKEMGMMISGPGWLSLLAYHDMRHLSQIQEIKQAKSHATA